MVVLLGLMLLFNASDRVQLKNARVQMKCPCPNAAGLPFLPTYYTTTPSSYEGVSRYVPN